jgi:hypothetical protein
MDRDIFRLVQTHESFVDDCIKGATYFPHHVPLYCVFVCDMLTYVYHPTGRWYGRRNGSGATDCHIEKVYRATLAPLIDRWVEYADLSDFWSDPHSLPEVRRLLAVSA